MNKASSLEQHNICVSLVYLPISFKHIKHQKLFICERMSMKRWYLGKEKLRGRTMPHYWMTKRESCLQLLIITLCKTTWSRCICVYFTFNFPVLGWEIEGTKHRNNNGVILQLAYAWERNRKSTHSQCARPAYTHGLHPFVLKGLTRSPGHRG